MPVKLPLKFKEKHLCFAANCLKNAAASASFETLLTIKTVLSGEGIQPDDEVQVQVDGETVITVYQGLGCQEERLANSTNTEMALSLRSQLEALVLLPDEIGDEARRVAQIIESIRNANLSEQAAFIAAGRDWLKKG